MTGVAVGAGVTWTSPVFLSALPAVTAEMTTSRVTTARVQRTDLDEPRIESKTPPAVPVAVSMLGAAMSTFPGSLRGGGADGPVAVSMLGAAMSTFPGSLRGGGGGGVAAAVRGGAGGGMSGKVNGSSQAASGSMLWTLLAEMTFLVHWFPSHHLPK
ncbi:MAG TPA: hypothetical protein VGV86_03590 [Acidimicrobiales bacterium]|nr:hypothetical protein [Acidimicrobiales bacterium]